MSISTQQYIKAHSTASVSINSNAGGGSVVSVKVLRDNGSGSYTVSFAGNKYSVKSNIPLKEGQVFKATVKYDGQKIILEQRGQTPAVINVSEELLLPDGSPGQQLSAYLSQFGLVQDKITVSLMQFLQQNGLKIDFPLMQKARLIALKFPGKEKQAADAALLLMEDGITAEEDIVRSLMDVFSGEQEDEGGNGGGNGGDRPLSQNSSNGGDRPLEQNSSNGGDRPLEQNSPRDEKTDKGDTPLDFTEKIYADTPSGKQNLLAFMNHYAKNKNHWIFLPFEFTTAGKTATGFLKLLLDISEKNIKKMQINASFALKKYFFVLKFNQSKVQEVRFCTLPSLLPSEVKSEELRLGGYFNSGMNQNNPVAVTYSALALTQGICTECEPPAFFEEEA